MSSLRQPKKKCVFKPSEPLTFAKRFSVESEQPSGFGNPVQTKLEVGAPGDRYRKLTGLHLETTDEDGQDGLRSKA
jgi:hypothetical protein